VHISLLSFELSDSSNHNWLPQMFVYGFPSLISFTHLQILYDPSTNSNTITKWTLRSPETSSFQGNRLETASKSFVASVHNIFTCLILTFSFKFMLSVHKKFD
jgi:hypothetical protein